jgi:hypothetical protein
MLTPPRLPIPTCLQAVDILALSHSPKIAHCERSVRLLPGTRVAAIASKDGDPAAYDLILSG